MRSLDVDPAGAALRRDRNGDVHALALEQAGFFPAGADLAVELPEGLLDRTFTASGRGLGLLGGNRVRGWSLRLGRGGLRIHGGLWWRLGINERRFAWGSVDGRSLIGGDRRFLLRGNRRGCGQGSRLWRDYLCVAIPCRHPAEDGRAQRERCQHDSDPRRCPCAPRTRAGIFDLLECFDELGCAREAVLRVLCQRLEHEGVDLPTEPGIGALCARRLGGFVHVHEHGRHRVAGLERDAARQHPVEDDADGVEIGAAVEFHALTLLGRHVVGGSHDRARLGELFFGCPVSELGDTEVDDLDELGVVLACADEAVVWLHVAMDDPDVVCGSESFEDLDRQCLGASPGQPLFAFDDRAEVLAVEVLHHEESETIDLTEVGDVDDVLVADLGGCLGLLDEPADGLRAAGSVWSEKLECDELVDSSMPREIDLPHATFANETLNFVAPRQDGASGEGRLVLLHPLRSGHAGVILRAGLAQPHRASIAACLRGRGTRRYHALGAGSARDTRTTMRERARVDPERRRPTLGSGPRA